MFQNKFLILLENLDFPPLVSVPSTQLGLSYGKMITTENEAQLVPTLIGTTQSVPASPADNDP